MKKLTHNLKWILGTLLGSAIFSLGFDLFLLPNDLNSGGVSGLAMILVHILKFGSVGSLSILINLPLFLLGRLKIGKQFFYGSMIGMLVSSLLIDLLVCIPAPQIEPLLATVYGGLLCGFGLGVVFVSGTSTGGSDILVRLLKMRYRNVPIGQISMIIDLVVATLTGIVFMDVTKALYTGVSVYITGKVIDAVVYRFDYSKVVMIISERPEMIAGKLNTELDRGATYLYGEGCYTGSAKKVIMTAVKKQQLAELIELVTHIDPSAFIIVQEAHQVLGDGFQRYSKDSL